MTLSTDGGRRPERPRGLELEARQLEYVERRHGPREQVERRLAQVAAGERRAARGGSQLGHHRRHGALAVGAGHRRDRRLRLARKELDVADHGQSATARFLHDGLAHRQARRDDDLVDVVEECRVEGAGAQLDLAVRGAAACEPRRLASRVGHAHRETAAAQVARAGHPGAAETEDERAGTGGERRKVRYGAHRSFSVARPTSTSTTVMIQKRTITFGSAQPLSS